MDLALRVVYNFDTINPTVLGSNYKGWTLRRISDFEDFQSKINIPVIQSKLINLLSTGISRNYYDYTYLMFEKDHEFVYMAKEWIVPSSLVSDNKKNVTFVLQQVAPSLVKEIRDYLNYKEINYTES